MATAIAIARDDERAPTAGVRGVAVRVTAVGDITPAIRAEWEVTRAGRPCYARTKTIFTDDALRSAAS